MNLAPKFPGFSATENTKKASSDKFLPINTEPQSQEMMMSKAEFKATLVGKVAEFVTSYAEDRNAQARLQRFRAQEPKWKQHKRRNG